MNNYPSSSHPRPLFPAYRDARRDFPVFGPQNRGQGFYEPNVQNFRLPIAPREAPPFRNMRHSTPLDPARGYLFPRHDELGNQKRLGGESPLYDLRRDYPATPTQRDILRSSYGNRMPKVDLTLREKFQNHLQKEIQELSEERVRFLRSNTNYKGDYSFPSNEVLEQDRLYSKLPPLNHEQVKEMLLLSQDVSLQRPNSSFQSDYSSPNEVLEQDRLFSELPPPKHEQIKELPLLSQEKVSLQRSNSSFQSDYSFSPNGVMEQDRLYLNVPPPKNNLQSFDRDYKSIQNETEYSKMMAMLSKEPLPSLGKNLFPIVEHMKQNSREFYDESKGHPTSISPSQPTSRLNQIEASLASEQNSNLSGKDVSFKSIEHTMLENAEMPLCLDTPIISTEKYETNSNDSVAFQFDSQKHKLLANQSVFETNSQSPVKEIARSLSLSATQSPVFTNKNDLQSTSNSETFFPENSALRELSNLPLNSFLPKNSDSKDGSMKSFGEDSLHKPEVPTKSNCSKNNLNTDDWPLSHSIPFLGETSEAKPGHPLSSPAETCSIQEKSEDDSILSNSSLTKSDEKKVKSTLEDALETLMIKEPVVGLDYIIEYKDIVSIDGGFPFHCELCNSSISRSLIIDHIQGFKHRFKFLKLKDDISYELVNKLSNQNEKDEYLYSASERLEKSHGRGNVVVKLGPSDSKKPLQIRFGKVANNSLCSSVSNQEEHISSEPFTIDKKEIFTSGICSDKNSSYGDEHHSSSSFPSTPTHKLKSNEGTKDDIMSTCSEESSKASFVEKSTEPDIKGAEHTTNGKELGQADLNLVSNHSLKNSAESLTRPASPSWYGQAKKLKQESPGDMNVPYADPVQSNKNDIDNGTRNEASSSTQLLNPMVFEQLSKCDISSDDEANSVLKIISALMKQLLRYKLQHIASEDVENLMTSVHSKPESVDKILDLIKGKASNIQTEFPVKGKENLDSINSLNLQAPNCPSEDNGITKDSQTFKCNENLNVTTSNASQPLGNNLMQTNSGMNTMPQSMNAAWLQPPPFFQNAVSTSSVPTSVSGSPLQNSGMTWSSAYQMQLAAMGYYQQQGFGTGSAMYPVPLCIPGAPVDASFLQLPLPPNEVFLPPPPPPATPLPTPPLPPATTLPKPPLPPASPLPKPPLPPASSLPKPPLPPSISSTPKPPLPPIGAELKQTPRFS